MIYTELTRKAAVLACRAHAGASDKSGFPYILHPVHVAEQMTSEDTCVVALLHDVVEDTEVTLEDLRKEGFTEVQIEAIRLMTREEGVPYMDYVRKIAENPVARTVKLADLAHNMDKNRITAFGRSTEKDEKRFRKYEEARAFLLSVEEQG